MFRRVAIGLLVVGLGGCASQQTQSFVVPPVGPPQDASPSYQQAALPPSQQATVTPTSSQWSPATTQALQTTKPVAAQLPPANNDQTITRQLIATSRLAYAGSCPCPYDVDLAGRCGDRSAYSRGVRNKPLCFATDVTPLMISRHRAGDAAMATGTN